MGILHYIGLKKSSRQLFSGLSLDEAVRLLVSSPHDFSTLIPYLGDVFIPTQKDLEKLISSEQENISRSLADTSEKRRARLKKTPVKPRRSRVYSYVYERSADVITEALLRAKGKCEGCGNNAPFERKTNKPLTLNYIILCRFQRVALTHIDNVLALSPNCHREMHDG
ncbi:hypothetical protein VSU01S_36730 [Vibrio superstes NBRC 103154]|uniref:HNH nuclease domain-containing protein n=1 Tax=Vibrio superstes NBRC 103154 TaxID=1219062 RepID=A0A511QVM9_9VIBR|nr:hypothetical protein VSU01S_36730 [Vibrio superstes NBRC 103154]